MTDYQNAFKHIEQFAELKMKEANIPGMAIAITDREKLLDVATYGFADIAARAPVTPDCLFEIASIGKSFTVIALLQLYDEGKLDIYSPVSEYLPWFKVQSEYPPITVHHLMGHTAGIIRGTELAVHGLYDSWALRETKTNVAPGEYWHYSSIGYKTLGFLLEELTGQSYGELIQSRILGPLGMNSTHAVINYETRKKSAIGYCSLYDDRPEHPGHEIVPSMWNEYGTGDGCQASTAEDMAIFLRMLINRGKHNNKRLISENSFKLMAPLDTWTGSEQYGYAIVAYPVDDCTFLGHGGSNGGYTSHILTDIEGGHGVVVLTNRQTESEAVYQITEYALKVLKAVNLCRKIPSLPSPNDPVSIANAVDYAGIYRGNNGVIQLKTKEKKLLLNYSGITTFLEQRAPDSFYINDPDLNVFLLKFKRDAGKVVEACHGHKWYINENYKGPLHFYHPEEWKAFTGHYRTRNPELSNFRVILRKGTLTLVYPSGSEEQLRQLEDGRFHIGDDDCSPEIIGFDTIVDGSSFRAIYSGCPYYRTFTN